jgi:hypothetical protein
MTALYLLNFYLCSEDVIGFLWSRGSVLAFGTQVRGFKPVGFLRAKKSSARLSSEGK